MECKCPFRKRAFTPSRSHRISGINFSLLVLGFLGGPSAYLSIYLRIDWIMSRIPCGISEIIFVQGSYESLAMLDGKTRQGPFFYGSIL